MSPIKSSAQSCQPLMTDYHANYLAHELTRRCASDSPDEGCSGNDQLKAKAVQILNTKGIANFKTA